MNVRATRVSMGPAGTTWALSTASAHPAASSAPLGSSASVRSLHGSPWEGHLTAQLSWQADRRRAAAGQGLTRQALEHLPFMSGDKCCHGCEHLCVYTFLTFESLRHRHSQVPRQRRLFQTHYTHFLPLNESLRHWSSQVPSQKL